MWAEHVRDRRRSRMLAHSIGDQVQRRSLSAVLHAWHAHVADVSWRRSAAEDQGQAVSRHLLKQNQLVCFKVNFAALHVLVVWSLLMEGLTLFPGLWKFTMVAALLLGV